MELDIEVEIFVPVLVLELDVKLDEDETTAPLSIYTDKRFPAPQYSNALPPHGKLQSLAGSARDPILKLFPQ